MSLFEDLLGRPVATEEVPIVLDRAAFAAAARRLDAAEQQLAAAGGRGEFDLDAERAEVAAARSALEAVPVRRVTVRALSPRRWNELINEHPPVDAAKARWNPDTLRLALLAESVVAPEGESAPSVAQWQQLEAAGALSDGELNELFVAAITLNDSAPRVALGKG